MNCYHDFDVDFARALEVCRAKIAAYPADFREDAARWLEKQNILNQDYRGNYISQLLPFWLKDVFRLDRAVCGKLSAGNIFGLLYFLILDAVMDAPPGESRGELLPLGNLFLVDFLEQFQELFPGDPDFRGYFRKYFQEWAGAVTREQNGYWRQSKNCSGPAMVLLAQKAAPLKLTAVAAGLLSNNQPVIEPLAELIDRVIITFQLLDDWNDWREDRAAGNCSYFLSQVMDYTQVAELSGVTDAHIQKAVWWGGVLDRIWAVMDKNRDAAKDAPVPAIPYLIAYHETLINDFRAVLARVDAEKHAVLAGGFAYFLYREQCYPKCNSL